MLRGEPIGLAIAACDEWRCGRKVVDVCDRWRGERWSIRVAGRKNRIVEIMGVRHVGELNELYCICRTSRC
jgi:hypothetical protein